MLELLEGCLIVWRMKVDRTLHVDVSAIHIEKEKDDSFISSLNNFEAPPSMLNKEKKLFFAPKETSLLVFYSFIYFN